MSKIIKLGVPPFPAMNTESGIWIAKIEHVWRSARRYAKQHGYQCDSSYGVVGLAPT